MKAKIVFVVLLIVLFVAPSYTFASIVFETTSWITGTEGEGLTFDFTANQSPYTYQATLTDLSEAPLFGFDYLYLSITSATDTFGSILGPGSFTFDVVPGEPYFANIFGAGSEESVTGSGLFGLEITTVPIPGAIWLMGSGLIGIIGLRRKFNK